MRILPLLLILFLPLSARAIGPTWPISDNPRFWVLGEGLFHMAFDGGSFRSQANYDGTGLAVTPSTLDSVTVNEFRAHGAFGFAPRVSLFAQLGYRTVRQAFGPNPPANTAAYSNGFGDSFVGARAMIYRSRDTDRVYPTDWSPGTFLVVAEGTWTFPLYDQVGTGYPPLGDQSNDLGAIGRVAWYANEWLAFSAGSGFIYRTAGYSHQIPFSLRGDVSLQERLRLRLWTEFQSFQRVSSSDSAVNLSQADSFPNGSLLYKSFAPIIRTGTVGAGYLASKSWEISLAGIFTATGNTHAKGHGFALGITWRPYQVPNVKFEEYRQERIAALKGETREVRRKQVARYGFRATIVKVSGKGNFVKILFGEKDRVREGDTFYILPPNDLSSQAYRPVASATVAKVQPDAAYLRIEERFSPDLRIRPGFETRRVYFEGE